MALDSLLPLAASALVVGACFVVLWRLLRVMGSLREADEDTEADERAPTLLNLKSQVDQLRLDHADLLDRVERWRKRDYMRLRRDGEADPTVDPRVAHLPSAHARLKKLAMLDREKAAE